MSELNLSGVGPERTHMYVLSACLSVCLHAVCMYRCVRTCTYVGIARCVCFMHGERFLGMYLYGCV